MNQVKNDEIREKVRASYARIAVDDNAENRCMNTSCCGDSTDEQAKNTSIKLGYSASEVSEAPEGANMGLGCGNPRAIASLKSGETVADLGSGGGFDCFLAVKEVGPSGTVIGVDMTPEMISKARRNAAKAEYNNVDFRLGEIENLPIADATIDVVISNCVINLSPNKARVMEEAHRVLKPGGRIAISDIVATADLPMEILNDESLFNGCMAGATPIEEYQQILKDAGFSEISITPKDESREFIRTWAPDDDIENYVVSANIEAVRPA